MARMKDFYVKEVAPALMKKFGYQSVMQIPKLEKIVINVGCGEARDNHKVIEADVYKRQRVHSPPRPVLRLQAAAANPGDRKAPATQDRVPSGLPSGDTAESLWVPNLGITATA